MTRSPRRTGLAGRSGTYPGRVAKDVVAWLRAHPWQADTLLAVLLFLLSADQIPAGPAGEPVAAFAAAAVIVAGQVAFGLQFGNPAPVVALEPRATDVVIAVLLYTLAAHAPRRISISGLVLCLLGVAVAVARWSPAHGPDSGGAVFGAVAGLGGAALTAWVLGDSVAYRYRRAHYAALEERAARLEAERDAQARMAAAAERAAELQERRARAVDESAARLRRIERDLHDGAQVRLTALALSLGEIKESLDAAGVAADGARGGARDSARGGADGGIEEGTRTRMLVAAAHRNAKETLAE